MLRNKIYLGIILSIILLFNINGFTSYYKYTQESGANFYVGTADKSDALEDTNEMRQIIDDLGNLLDHSKRDDSYPKDETIGGTLAIPNSALVSFATGTKGDLFYCSTANTWIKLNIGSDNQILVVATDVPNWETPSSDLLSDVTSIAMLDENEDIAGAWTISGSIEGVDATEFGYLDGITSDIQTQFGLRYLKTEIDELSEVETIYSVDIIDSTELAALKFTDLDDTPAGYDNGKYAKSTVDGVVWDTPAGGGTVTTSGTPEVNDIARFTGATVIEGLTYDELITALALNSDDLSDVASIAMLDENEAITGDWTITGSIAGVDNTEFGYLDGVTSDIQTQLDTKKGKNYYSALGSDHAYSDNADLDSQLVGESVVFGDLLYFDWADKEWKKAKADVYATTPAERIALESKSDGQTCLMLVKGYIRDDSAFDFGASRIYLNDDTAGSCDDTAPAESGDQIQMVGTAKSADILFFDPSIDVGEI